MFEVYYNYVDCYTNFNIERVKVYAVKSLDSDESLFLIYQGRWKWVHSAYCTPCEE